MAKRLDTMMREKYMTLNISQRIKVMLSVVELFIVALIANGGTPGDTVIDTVVMTKRYMGGACGITRLDERIDRLQSEMGSPERSAFIRHAINVFRVDSDQIKASNHKEICEYLVLCLAQDAKVRSGISAEANTISAKYEYRFVKKCAKALGVYKRIDNIFKEAIAD